MNNISQLGQICLHIWKIIVIEYSEELCWRKGCFRECVWPNMENILLWGNSFTLGSLYALFQCFHIWQDAALSLWDAMRLLCCAHGEQLERAEADVWVKPRKPTQSDTLLRETWNMWKFESLISQFPSWNYASAMGDWTTMSIWDLDPRLIVYPWKTHPGTRLKLIWQDSPFWLLDGNSVLYPQSQTRPVLF